MTESENNNASAVITIPATFVYGGGIMKWLPVWCGVSPSVYRVPRPNSSTERPRKPKIGRMEAHDRDNPWTYLEVERSKSRSPGRLMLTQTMHHTQVGALQFS